MDKKNLVLIKINKDSTKKLYIDRSSYIKILNKLPRNDMSSFTVLLNETFVNKARNDIRFQNEEEYFDFEDVYVYKEV